ncbi:phosphate transport system regulator [Deferribacter desulfuricans SSM1]|uniref:Phosphate-specific transport system accessory protein PhoU n=1 Tax=Deferribacter desulfuricans (strain DSM 14783 / JCM 11476 / NBRC 101012 / SSM1) TaxID=639282 RepID=D3PBC5_DEFDS|nr:phosphate signaling complex protein PhoU [Deferribacter desulfuricans]BAI79898.1 phosphate transport system regulator [Deferribacter desulfuricans SSM1]
MKALEERLINIKTGIAKMSQIVVDMVHYNVKALVERDSNLAQKVIDLDEDVDQLDIEIDEQCLEILALYNPKAIDLRSIVTALRLIVDLERIGDHNVDIAKEIIKLNQIPPVKPYIDLPKMAEASAEMVKDAINAYFEKDTEKSLEIIKRDDFIDDLHQQIIRELLTYIAEDIRKTKGAISLMFITRSIERIADHATNLAELVYFMATGKIIRHIHIEDL